MKPETNARVKIPLDALEPLLLELRRVLETAPNPRVLHLPPAAWAWYEGPRAAALSQLDQVLWKDVTHAG